MHYGTLRLDCVARGWQHHLQISSQCRRRSVYSLRRDPCLLLLSRARTALDRLETRSMSPQRREIRSAYIEWAKLRSAARYKLAGSDMLAYPLKDLPVRIEQLEIANPSDSYGYPPLIERLAKKAGVPADCVVQAQGTSMANHLAMAALLEPDDEVLIEEPAYEAILAVAHYLGAKIRRFPRRFENGFKLDPREVERAISPHPANRSDEPPQSHRSSHTGFDTKTRRRYRTQPGRARPRRRGLSRRVLRFSRAIRISSRFEFCCDEQLDESLRSFRPTLRLDARCARAGRKNVAAQ